MDRSKWEYKKLGEVCILLNGFAFKSEKYVDNGIRVMRITNVQKGEIVDDDPKFYPMSSQSEIQRYMLKENDLLVSLTGNVGRVGLLQRELLPAALNQRVACLRLKGNSTDLRYLFHLMNSNLFENECIVNSQGIAQKNMSTKWLSDYELPIPPIADQQRIVAELDCLNEMIAVKQEQLKEFDKLAQSIFYDMFESIDKSVPASHYIESLGGGKSLAGEIECTNKVLKTGAVTYDYFKEDEVKNLPVDYQPLEEHLLKDGDLLVSRMNTLEYVGAIAYVWKAPQNTYLPDRLWRAKLKSGANPIYLWYSLKQDKAKEQIRSKASGTSGSMKNISMPKFLSTTIKDVPLALQQQFAEKIQAIEAQKELVKKSIAETQHLLDSRMDYYFD